MGNSVTRVPAGVLCFCSELCAMPEILEMRRFQAHRGTSVYDHSVGVMRVSLRMAARFHMREARMRRLAVAAMLHDFYLYDYHGRRTLDGWHAWRHPAVALENASRLFELEPDVRNAIRAHMFPGTLFHVPRYSIGWVVSVSDKLCAVLELLGSRWAQDLRFSSG